MPWLKPTTAILILLRTKSSSSLHQGPATHGSGVACGSLTPLLLNFMTPRKLTMAKQNISGKTEHSMQRGQIIIFLYIV